MTIADIFIALARILSGILGKPDAIRRMRNHDVAELLLNVGNCLDHIANKLETGVEPVTECAELFYYSQRLPSIIRKAAGFWGSRKARHLANILEMSVEAPSNAVGNLKSRSRLIREATGLRGMDLGVTCAEKEIAKLREASGLYTAAAKVINSGFGL